MRIRMELALSSALPRTRSAYSSAGFDEGQLRYTRMHAGVWTCVRIRYVRSSPWCLQCLVVGSCLLLAVLATHIVKETVWDVVVVPEVAVVQGIVGVNAEIRADICFLLR